MNILDAPPSRFFLLLANYANLFLLLFGQNGSRPLFPSALGLCKFMTNPTLLGFRKTAAALVNYIQHYCIISHVCKNRRIHLKAIGVLFPLNARTFYIFKNCKTRGASEKCKNLPCLLFGPRSVNFVKPFEICLVTQSL